MNSKKQLLIGIVLALVAALLFRYLGADPGAEGTEAETVAEEFDSATPRREADDEPRVVPTDDPASMDESPEELVAAGYDDHPSIRQYKTLTRYPRSTRRLRRNSTDLLNPNKRHERRQPLPDAQDNANRAWEVLYTADRYFVQGEGAVTVRLALWHEGDPVIPTGAQMIAAQRGVSASDDQVSLSVQRVDSELHATLSPNEHWPDYIGELEVTVSFGAPGLREQTGRLRFYFTGEERIPARFTGRFSDDTRHGDLAIEVGVRVDTEGTYRIEGNLFDRDDQPIAWAQAETALAAGEHDVALVFYGLAFHDAGAAAPFTLRQLRGYRMRRGDSPHREDIPPYEGEYETSARYSLSNFRSQEYESPHKQRMLERYRDAMERGVVLTEPEFVGDGRQP